MVSGHEASIRLTSFNTDFLQRQSPRTPGWYDVRGVPMMMVHLHRSCAIEAQETLSVRVQKQSLMYLVVLLDLSPCMTHEAMVSYAI